MRSITFRLESRQSYVTHNMKGITARTLNVRHGSGRRL